MECSLQPVACVSVSSISSTSYRTCPIAAAIYQQYWRASHPPLHPPLSPPPLPPLPPPWPLTDRCANDDMVACLVGAVGIVVFLRASSIRASVSSILLSSLFRCLSPCVYVRAYGSLALSLSQLSLPVLLFASLCSHYRRRYCLVYVRASGCRRFLLGADFSLHSLSLVSSTQISSSPRVLGAQPYTTHTLRYCALTCSLLHSALYTPPNVSQFGEEVGVVWWSHRWVQRMC